MRKTFIVAGTKAQAKLCAEKNNKAKDEFVIVNAATDVYGIDSPEIWYTGSYYMNRYVNDLTNYCRVRNIPIIMK